MPDYTYLKVNLEAYVGESQGDVSLDTNEKKPCNKYKRYRLGLHNYL